MYTIRVDSERQLLLISLSGRVTTAEASRAVSQAFALADAVGIRAASCDLSALERGPGGSLAVAALIALQYEPGMRIAFVGGGYHSMAVRRLIRFSGIKGGMRFCSSTMSAEAWLAPVVAPSLERLSLTEQLHLRGPVGTAPLRQRRKRESDTEADEARERAESAA